MAGEKEMEADAGGDRHLQFRVLELSFRENWRE